MALLTTNVIHYKNTVGKLSNLNLKAIRLNGEKKLMSQSFQHLSTSIDIYKKANFSPWLKSRNICLPNEYIQMIHTYKTLAKINPSTKLDYLTQNSCNNGIFSSYIILNHQMQQQRLLTSTQEKPNPGASKFKRFGGALIIGIAVGGGKLTKIDYNQSFCYQYGSPV